MGELLDAYRANLDQDAKEKTFEHWYASKPDAPNSMPTVEANLVICIDRMPEANREKGQRAVEITTSQEFTDAMALFTVLYRIKHHNEYLTITERSFLTDTLQRLGLSVLTRGDKNTPATFGMKSDVFWDLAEQGFYKKGVYHGKPQEISTMPDIITGITSLSLARNEETRKYTLESRALDTPEKADTHVAMFELALLEWKKTRKMMDNAAKWMP
jgi:hypothetical protein